MGPVAAATVGGMGRFGAIFFGFNAPKFFGAIIGALFFLGS
jgi:hypothetical protein